MTIWIFKEGEIEMSKKLIIAMALSLVLVSGGLFCAQADHGSDPFGWYLPTWSSSSATATGMRDADMGYNIGNNEGKFGPNASLGE